MTKRKRTNKTYHTVESNLKTNQIIVETVNIHKIHLYDRSPSWLATAISIKSGVVKLVL